MRFFTDINALFYTFSIALGGMAGATPFCPDTIDTAGGGPPNSGIPTVASSSAIKELQLALFLENLEVAFFSAGLSNITQWGTSGYPNDTVKIVNKTAAQEEVHVASLVNLLDTYGTTSIPPCNYSFPVNSTEGFFELAHIIESVGIGAVIGLAERLVNTDPLLERLVSSMLTVESRHDAFFRHVQGAVPNPAPFETGISDIWAYNLALSFIVPGSCPVELPLPIFPRLTIYQSASAAFANSSNSVSQMEFTWDPMQTPFVAEAGKQLLIGWVNQLNAPAYTALNVTAGGKGTAYLPQGMNGVAFAVVTVQQPNNVNDLALATLAGPVAVPLS